MPSNLISEAQSRAVDDMTIRKECSMQHVQESGLDIHGQHGLSSVATCKEGGPSLDRSVTLDGCYTNSLLSRTQHGSPDALIRRV